MSVAESVMPVGTSVGAMYARAYRAEPKRVQPTREENAEKFPPAENASRPGAEESAATADILDKAVEQANDRLRLDNRTLRFRINEVSGELQVQIIDSERDKVIRSIPSDEMIKLSARMRELSGVGSMIDHSR